MAISGKPLIRDCLFGTTGWSLTTGTAVLLYNTKYTFKVLVVPANVIRLA